MNLLSVQDSNLCPPAANGCPCPLDQHSKEKFRGQSELEIKQLETRTLTLFMTMCLTQTIVLFGYNVTNVANNYNVVDFAAISLLESDKYSC